MIYHVLNRGNGRMRIFHKPGDFAAFERVLAEGLRRYPVELFTYCVLSSHWHLVVRPKTGVALGRLMGWVGVTHVRRHHEHYHTRGGGHLYQGRFKSFPVEEDDYFLTLCRYVEANALRAGMVERAEDWQYSGLWRRIHGKEAEGLSLLSPWPMERPRNWRARVNTGLAEKQLETLRDCVGRGRPYGGEQWVAATAKRLGLEFTLRGPGRPRKAGNE
jgi:putative transposase